MERQAVQSRDIAVVGYDLQTTTLEITFRLGGVYHYANVPATVHESLLASASHGIYFNQYIKDKYPHVKIR